MFYGLDVHKEFIQVCVLDAKGTKREEYRVGGSAEEVEAFAKQLQPSDQVVLEATFHTWILHDILSRHVDRVVVANPLQVKAIAQAKIKTDKVDAFTLAKLLRADFLPEVQLPDPKAWALRQLVSHRRLLVKQRTATKNSIHAVLNRRSQPEQRSLLKACSPMDEEPGTPCCRIVLAPKLNDLARRPRRSDRCG